MRESRPEISEREDRALALLEMCKTHKQFFVPNLSCVLVQKHQHVEISRAAVSTPVRKITWLWTRISRAIAFN